MSDTQSSVLSMFLFLGLRVELQRAVGTGLAFAQWFHFWLPFACELFRWRIWKP